MNTTYSGDISNMESTQCFSLLVFAMVAFVADHVSGNCPCDTMVQTNQPNPQDPAYCASVTAVVTCFQNQQNQESCKDSAIKEMFKPDSETAMRCKASMDSARDAGAQMEAQKKCMMKCAKESGLNLQESPVTDEDAKSNKDGICGKITKMQTCLETVKAECESNNVYQVTSGMVNMKAKLCPDGKKGEEPKDDSPKDSAAGVHLSLLLLLLPVLQTFF